MIVGENYKEFKELYLTCFTEDSEADAEFLFSTVFKRAECICRLDKGRPIAMLFLMDCKLIAGDERLPFYYLYAAATHPDYRGRGIMGELLSEAKDFAVKTGRKGIFLKPATKSLFGFYSGYGFRPFFKIKRLTVAKAELDNISPTDGLSKLSELTYLTGEEWKKKRIGYLKGLSNCFSDFSSPLFAAATEGLSIYKLKNGGLVFEKRDDLLLIKELIPGEKGDILPLIKELMEKTGTNTAEVRLPSGAEIALPPEIHANTEDFSVIWDDGSLDTKEFSSPYHGFAFD